MSLVKLDVKHLAALLLALTACGPTAPQGQTTPDPNSDPHSDPHSDPNSSPPGDTDPTGPTAAPAASGDAPTPEMGQLLATHNAMRARHCAAPLTWSAQLEAYAQRWANHLRDANCAFDHSPGNAFGENLAGGSPGALDASAVTAMWYGEVSQYRFPDGGFGMDTGHFTQLVWRGTTEMGCAKATCSGTGMELWVCEYNPAGNVDGGYRTNVQPTGCK